MNSRSCLVAPLLLGACTATALADWSNIGGNQGRNGLVPGLGPQSATLRWSGGPSSIIAWNPSTEGDRLFVVRQTSFVPNGVPNDSRVHALSVTTGAQLWPPFACPFASGDWTTNVYGVSHGRVYVGRGGNGSSSFAPVHCLDAATGGLLWVSVHEVGTGAYDGVVFADNGDPIFATHLEVRRIRAADGTTAWVTPRNCSVSGDCGPAIAGGSIYIDEVAPGGQILTRVDLETGAKLYSSPVMPGFLSQNTPMCGENGMVFYARTQGNETVDFFFAWQDTGSAFVFKWKEPALAGAGVEHGVTADGGVLMLSTNQRIQKRDQVTGALIAESDVPVTTQFTQSHFAIDDAGLIFYGNGGFPGTIYSFDPDLTMRWSVPVNNLNQGGPVLASDGTLLVAGVGTDLRAYWTEPACAPADFNCDGAVDGDDLGTQLGAWGPCMDCPEDLNDDGVVDGDDLGALLGDWTG
ncbi:MAG: PQQ-like beta-propeller repeat protein [Phycisphaerae bacterium]|nr:PQQ-like beta-propeller repeat protein [Phycisphaerae bacterium]